MKVTGFLGSPRLDGNTSRLVDAILEGAKEKGAETERFNLNGMKINPCQACYSCRKYGDCVQEDDMQRLYQDILSPYPIIIGFPIYMWQMSGQTKCFIDRMLPVLGYNFKSRIPKSKKVVLAVTHGAPSDDAFKAYIDTTAKMLGFLGFDVADVIIAPNMGNKGDIDKEEGIICKAREIGRSLL